MSAFDSSCRHSQDHLVSVVILPPSCCCLTAWFIHPTNSPFSEMVQTNGCFFHKVNKGFKSGLGCCIFFTLGLFPKMGATRISHWWCVFFHLFESPINWILEQQSHNLFARSGTGHLAHCAVGVQSVFPLFCLSQPFLLFVMAIFCSLEPNAFPPFCTTLVCCVNVVSDLDIDATSSRRGYHCHCGHEENPATFSWSVSVTSQVRLTRGLFQKRGLHVIVW